MPAYPTWTLLAYRSTWQGFIALLSAFAIAACLGVIQALITFGLAAAGLINVSFPDGRLRR